MLVVGVNGGGKTTTIGKLAHRLQGEGAQVGGLGLLYWVYCVFSIPTTKKSY